MSRRESRNSLGVRQSNGLEEFENFKKKYLLVNKHIAKLNSSLNVRIEELLSQIAALNIDNLRLRASELSLSRKLESEQEKSRRLYTEAEAATQLLYSQISSLGDVFGIHKSSGTNPLREQAAAARNRAPKIPAPALARLARPPEVETLVEVAEEPTPPRPSSRRTAYSPPPDPVTPVSRRRSTGSTPTSGTAAETSKTPPPSQEENRRSSVPLSMEITNGTSPLTPCVSSSVVNPVLSPSPAQSPKDDKESFSVVPAATSAPEILPESKDEIPHMTFKMNGLRRISRRPSGLLMTEQDRFGVPPAKNTVTPVAVDTPLSNSSAGQVSHSNPLPTQDVLSTPPRSRSMLAPPGASPIPMSPLTANPALSPPPTKKPSLTRRQLDFGIVDPEDQTDDEDAESNENMPMAEGLLGVESDSVIGKRAMKRKEPEDGEDLFPAAPMQVTSRKRQERRRDTGPIHTSVVLHEKRDIDTILKDRESKESKESLRDVTNERSTPPLMMTKSTDEKPKVNIGIGKPVPFVKPIESGVPLLSVAGLAAKLERLSTRPKPPAPPTPLPLPLSDKDVKISLAEEDAPMDGKSESAAAELGRRESGRQRKSVNYKEPSLMSKMRKPDSSGPLATSSAPHSFGSLVTASLQAAQKPGRRKKGSTTLISDGVNGSTASLVSNDGEIRMGVRTSGETPQPIDIERNRRRTAALRRFGDLSDDDEDKSEEDDEVENTLASKQLTPAPHASRYTFSALQGLRGPSILSRGMDPIIGSAPASASTASETISVAMARSTAALRMAPGAARERLREEITSGITSGARREREKERLREESRERERERVRETPNDVVV